MCDEVRRMSYRNESVKINYIYIYIYIYICMYVNRVEALVTRVELMLLYKHKYTANT